MRSRPISHSDPSPPLLPPPASPRGHEPRWFFTTKGRIAAMLVCGMCGMCGKKGVVEIEHAQSAIPRNPALERREASWHLFLVALALFFFFSFPSPRRALMAPRILARRCRSARDDEQRQQGKGRVRRGEKKKKERGYARVRVSYVCMYVCMYAYATQCTPRATAVSGKNTYIGNNVQCRIIVDAIWI